MSKVNTPYSFSVAARMYICMILLGVHNVNNKDKMTRRINLLVLGYGPKENK